MNEVKTDLGADENMFSRLSSARKTNQVILLIQNTQRCGRNLVHRFRSLSLFSASNSKSR